MIKLASQVRRNGMRLARLFIAAGCCAKLCGNILVAGRKAFY